VRVQVRQETAFSRVQCVGTVVTGHRTLARLGTCLFSKNQISSSFVWGIGASSGFTARSSHSSIELSIARPKCQTRDSQRWRSIR
jgi:hypothetical protein